MNKGKTVATRIPPSTYKRILKEVDTSEYLTVSDYIRIAIREKLNKKGVNHE